MSPPDDLAGALAEFEAHLPGLPGYMEPDAPGMHTTDTIDFEVVLEGEIWLELDDGVTAHLKAGDTVVQNGTRHAWRNHGTETCRLAVFICGAHHDNVPLAPSAVDRGGPRPRPGGTSAAMTARL